MGVAALLSGGASSQQAAGQATSPSPPPVGPDGIELAPAPTSPDLEVTPIEQADAAALAEAAVNHISSEKPLPAGVKLTAPVAEVVKLAESGVDENVLMAFVTNSTSLFELDANQIIYLNDIGVPGTVVTAMMQRDEALKRLMGGGVPLQAASEPGIPVQYAPQPDAAPAPPEMAPEEPPPGDNGIVDNLPPPAEDTGYSTFYGSLAPYGTWVDVAGYGPCWQPTVVVANPTWRPYCDGGCWIYTDCGWYWRSGYSWGWAPFHYGRWFRHNRLGWCWAPDTVWGPSWVCWRYSGSHCGWAPLPPGAWYRPGVGLTYHGRQVSRTYGFGLGARSFAFVETSHFRNPHLNRHALPPQQAAQVYNRTQVSTTIAESNRRIVNHGIPVSHVAEATGTEVRRVAIRDANTAARQDTRSERFEGDSRTLSVYRPHFAPPSGPQPGSGGRSKSELRNGGSIPAAASTTHGVIREPLTRAGGGTATTATSSTRTMSTVRSDPAPRSAAPLILHGPDRPGQGATGGRAGAVREALPPNALVVRGSKEVNKQQTARPSSAWTTETPRSWPTARSQDASTRPVANEKPQWAMTTRSEPAWSAPRATELPVRSEAPRQYTAPSDQAPAAVPWVAPAQIPTAPPRPSYSPPPVSSAPRMQTMEPRPAYSAPSAPAAAAPAAHGNSSSGRNGR